MSIVADLMSIVSLYNQIQKHVFDKSISKNRKINRNIREFQKNYGLKVKQSREINLKPEVLIPCHYKHIPFLVESLQSIPKGIPVTVIIDASDSTVDPLIKDISCIYQVNFIVNEGQQSQAEALNLGVSRSSNNLFIVLNADDCLLKYSVSTLLDLFIQYPTIRLAGGGCIPFTNKMTMNYRHNTLERLNYVPEIKVFGPADALSFTVPNNINMTMSGSCFLKSAWQTVDGFWDFKDRVCSYDDRDFQMRVSAIFNVAVIDEPLCFYRIHSSLGRGENL
jgi:GT2 family glycosyltransferase